MLDVAVIGGGPVGSQLAYKLAMAGHHVMVFEKRAGIGEKPCCTGIISQECISTFNIPFEVVFRQVNSAKIFSPSGEYIRVQRPGAQAYIINRAVFDKYMAGKAQSLGVEYRLSSKIVNVISRNDSVLLEIEGEGEVRNREAQVAVLTTGFNSPLVKRLGFGQPSDFVAGAQAEVHSNGVDEVEVHFDQKLAQGFFAWLVPTAEGRCLAGLMSKKSPGYYLRSWLNDLAAQRKIIPDKHQILYGGIPLKPLSRTYNDRLLVVGDAAGQVKPTTGGGIYFGMLCADIAANTLHKAIQSRDFSASSLSSYEHDWRKKLNHELKREYVAHRIYQHLSNGQINALFVQIRSSGIVDSLLKENISFDRHGSLLLKVLKIGVMSQANRLLRFPLSLAR